MPTIDEKRTGPTVRTEDGLHFISMDDFLTFPATVRKETLPAHQQLYVTRLTDLVMVIREPTPEERAKVQAALTN